ncbi:hypothetical protein H4R34_004880, partial [Dimargaris verticillata]
MATLLLPPAKSQRRWSLFKRCPDTAPKDSFEFQHDAPALGPPAQALSETMSTTSSAEPSLFSNDPHDDNTHAHAASTDDPSPRLLSRKTTRRQRRFQLAFPDVSLPTVRSMYKSFKCALDYDVFWKGYLFITPQAVYFYGRRLNPFVRFNTAAVAMVHPDADTANASSYPTAVHICLTFETISSIHKESILGMFPNVIRIKTPRRHYILAGFYARESAYRTLRTAWQRHHTSTEGNNATIPLEVESFAARGTSAALIRQGESLTLGALYQLDPLMSSPAPSRHIAFASPPDIAHHSVQSTPRNSRSTMSDLAESHASTSVSGRCINPAKSATLMDRLSAFGRKVSRRKPKPTFSDPSEETASDAPRLTSPSSPTIVVPRHDPLSSDATTGASVLTVKTTQLTRVVSTLSPASSTRPSTPLPVEASQPQRSHRSQGRRRRKRPSRGQTGSVGITNPDSPGRSLSPMDPCYVTNQHDLSAGSGGQLQGEHIVTTISSDATGRSSKCNTSPALPPFAQHHQCSNMSHPSSRNLDSLPPQPSCSTTHSIGATTATAGYALSIKAEVAPEPMSDMSGYYKSPPLTLGLNTVTSAFHDIKSHMPSLPYTSAASWAPIFNLAKKAPQMLTRTLTSEWSSGTREVATSTADLSMDEAHPIETSKHSYRETAPDQASMLSTSGMSAPAFAVHHHPYCDPLMANPAAVSRQSAGPTHQSPTAAGTRPGRWFPDYMSLTMSPARYGESASTRLGVSSVLNDNSTTSQLSHSSHGEAAAADAWTAVAGPALSMMPSKLALGTAARRWSLPGADIEHWLQSQARHQALAQSYHMVSTFGQQPSSNRGGARPSALQDLPHLPSSVPGPAPSAFGPGMFKHSSKPIAGMQYYSSADETNSHLAHDVYCQAQQIMSASPTALGRPEFPKRQ